MLRDITASLKFPKLVRTGEGKLRNDPEPVDIYELKFQYDQILDNWIIPLQYKWIHELKFALRPNYLREIRHCAVQASLEWNRSRGFDTSIREACLEPSISYIRTIFMLLQDCIYDEKEGYWDRAEEKRDLTKYLLGFKFWFGQTGLGCVLPHTGLRDACARCKSLERTPGKSMIGYYDRIENLYETLYKIIQIEIDKNVCPDIVKGPVK